MKIEQIDRNFLVKSDIARPGITYFSVMDPPFTVHGLIREGEKWVRMPSCVAEQVNPGVKDLNACTAGGRVRFKTSSPYIAIAVKYNVMMKMPHFAFTGSIGFDLYTDGVYAGSYINGGDDREFESVIDLYTREERTITIHFPLYSGVDELFIGLEAGCSLEKAPDYAIPEPVVFYGSSITQGACASRPGTCSDNLLSRLLDCEHVNLGFSGSARGESAMAEYLSGLKMRAFVLDYDYNAPSPEHLLATHEPLFRRVRAAQPELPVIMLSRPKYHLAEGEEERVSIIRQTYEHALADGDKNVYFLPGPSLIEPRMIETATVDNCHPNDSGFVCMAYAVKPVLEKIFHS